VKFAGCEEVEREVSVFFLVKFVAAGCFNSACSTTMRSLAMACAYGLNQHSNQTPSTHPITKRSYEGLTRDAVAHGMGVMVFGNGTGGGLHLRDVRRGDK